MAIIDLDSPATSGNIIDLDAPTPAAPAESGLMATIGGGFKQMVRAAGAEADLLQGDLPELQQAAREQQARVKDTRLQAFEADLQARRERLGSDPGWLDVIGEVGGAAWKNPAGAGLMVAEQLPNAAAVMGGGAAGALAGSALGPVGTVAGGVAGMFAGNVAIEGGSKALEHVARTDALSDDDRGRLIKEGAVKAGVITGVDALTFGASKWITGTARRAAEVATLRVAEQNGVAAGEIAARRAADPAFNAAVTSAEKLAVDGANTLGQRAIQTGAALALETVGEGAGEYLGEFAATGEADKMDAVIEAFSSLGQSAAEVVVAKAMSRPRTLADVTKPDATLEQSIAAAAAVVDGAGDPLGAAIAGVADQRTQLAEGDAALALGDTDQPVAPPVTLPAVDAAEIQRQNALGMMTPRSGTGLAPDATLPIVGAEPPVVQPLVAPEQARSPAWYAQIAELSKMDDTVLGKLRLTPEQQTAIATARSTPAGTIETPVLAKTAGGQAEIERAKLAERSIATVRAEEAAQAELAAQPAQPTGMPPTTAPAAPSTALVPATTYAVGPDGVAVPVPSQPVTSARGSETVSVPSQVSVRYEQNPSGTQILTLTPKGVENLDAIRATLTAAGIKTAASKRTESGVVLQVSKKTDAAAVRNAIQAINAQYSTERTSAEAELANQEFQDVEADSTARTEAPATATEGTTGPVRTVTGPDAGHIRAMLKVPADQKVAVVAPHTLPSATAALTSGRMSAPVARTITQLAGMLGRKVQFFEGSHQISEGIYAQGDTLYINVDGKVDALAVAGHEFTHSLRKTSPELYDKAHAAVVTMLRANGRRAVKYRKYYHGAEARGKSADDIAHELLADIGGNEWRSGEFWTDVFAEVDAQHTPKEARTIITRLRDAIVAFIDKLIRATPKKGFALEGVGFTREELRGVRDLIVKAAAEAYLQTERAGAMEATETGEAQESKVRKEDAANQTMPARWPTAAGLTPSVNDELLTDMATLRQNEVQYGKAVNAILQDPGMRSPDITTGTLDEKAEHIIERMKTNLLWLYDQIPEAIRERSKLWYDGARKISEAWAKRYDITESQAAGALAVLSPQKDWFMNVTMAERVLDIVHTKLNHTFDSKMDAAAFGFLTKESLKDDPESQKNLNAYEAVKGKTLRDVAAHNNLRQMSVWIRAYDEAYHDAKHAIVTPEGGFAEDKTTVKGEPTMRAWGDFNTPGKAASIYFNGSAENINKQLGKEHKVRNFYNNIFAPKDPRFLTADTHAVAAKELRPLAGADKPVAENFGKTGGTNVTGLSGAYAIHHEAYNRAAAERGVLPREMQSITWEAVRGLFTEGYKGKKDNIAAIDAIWRKVDAGELSANEARQQILAHAGGIVQPDWWNEGNSGYKEVLRDKTYDQTRAPFGGAKVTFEVAPDPRNAEQKSRWDALPAEVKAEISHKVAWKIAAKALASFGDENMKGELHAQSGGWMADTNPSLSVWFNKRAASTKISQFARILGFALNQQGMMRTSPRPFKASDGRTTAPSGVVLIDLPAGADVELLYKSIRGIVDAKGVPYVSGHTTSTEQMAIIHMDEKKISTVDLAKKIADVVPDYRVTHSSIHVDFPEKGRNSYGLRGKGADPSESSLRARSDQLRAEAGVLIDQLIGERSNATGGGSVRESTARYGDPVGQHAVSVVGVHYSRQQRQELSSRHFGTGLKGQEGPRVAAATDPRIKQRLYFYASTGKGIAPESGVGAHAHSVQLDNVYDMDVDPLRLYVPQKPGDTYRSPDLRMNDFESAVIDAGFDGYMTREFGKGGAVVLLGTHSVPVQYEGEGVRPEVDAAPAPRYSDLQRLRREIAENRALPAGQMTGLEWKRLLMREMPEVDPRWLDNDALYRKGDLLAGAMESKARGDAGVTPDDIKTNPSSSALLGALNKSHDKALRYVLDEDGAFHFWDAWLDNHPEGAAAAGVTYDYTRRGGLYLNTDGSAEFTNDFGVKIEELRRYMTGDTFRFYMPGHGAVTGDEARAIVDAEPQQSTVRTDTPAFKQWFGDSIVTNADGSPKTMYHGTARDISEFRPKQANAIFVTDNPNFASDFAQDSANWISKNEWKPVSGQNVMPLYVRAENPFDMDNPEHLAALEAAVGSKWEGGFGENTIDDVAAGAWKAIESPTVQRYIRANHDSFYVYEGGNKNLAVYEPTQIKSASGNRGTYDRTDARIDRSTTRSPWYYSELARAIDNAPAKVFSTGKQVAAWLQSNAGKLSVKKAEIDATGVLDWLATQDKVTQAQVSAYLQQGGVQLTETVLDNPFDEDNPTLPYGLMVIDAKELDSDEHTQAKRNKFAVVSEESGKPYGYGNTEEEAISDAYGGYPELFTSGGEVKFSAYQLPGGTGYKEWLLTLPSDNTYDKGELTKFQRAMIDKYDTLNWKPLATEQERSEHAAIETRFNRRKDQFRSSHFDQPNIVAHIRTNERTDAEGRRVLFIEEIQSDYGATIRKSRKTINAAVDSDFLGIARRMEADGVLEIDCD